MMKTFDALNVSSKFAICGLPIRVDTYKTCSFGCTYCFANNRKIMEFEKTLRIGDMKKVRRTLDRVLVKKDVKESNFLDALISKGITWHCGGMSDPFQPVEAEYKVTSDLVNITKEFGVSVLFSTKSDTVYGAEIDPDLHTFQLSVSNVQDRRDLEPNVPPISRRLDFFDSLKNKGFRVGIRIQPFIPNVTTLEILEMFKGADNVSIEGLKLVPQNREHREFLTDALGLNMDDFTQMGLLNIKPEKRLELYKPFIEWLKANHVPFSIADNDLHYIGTNSCCCGDRLVSKSSTFNNTAMMKKYGLDYTKGQLDSELKSCGVDCCRCNQLFTSNRQNGCTTVSEFYDDRFCKKSSPFSPSFQYREDSRESLF